MNQLIERNDKDGLDTGQANAPLVSDRQASAQPLGPPPANANAPSASDPQNPYLPATPSPTPASGQQPTAAQQSAQSGADVLGIISLVMIFLFPLVGLILGIVGVSKAKKEGRSTALSLVGAIINGFFIVATTLFLIFAFWVSTTATDELNEFIDTNPPGSIQFESDLYPYPVETL